MAWHRIWSILSILALSSFRLTQQQPSSRKSPPRADVASIQEKLHLGQNLKLTCPIQGDPTPLFEWFKDGEKIDHTWLDYVTRSNNKVLKIRAAKLDDTGLFVCRGVNGFGKAQVNIHLIVVDPQANPQENKFKAPKFTTETQVAPLHYFRKIGETFSVTCEALGNPIPEIVWLKNGHKLSSGANYIHAGKSSMDLVVLDASDAGLYSCMARNAIGSVTQNYSLEANGGLNPSSAGSHGPLVVVTGISPVNSTLLGGQSGKLTCTVRSQDTPHIKWLKQVSQDATFTSEANILNVRDNRYQILPTAKDIKVNKDAYVNILSLDDVTEADNGTYICFVAKNGLNSLTFKSATVFVMPGNQISVDVKTKNNIRKNGQIILEKSEVTSLGGEGQISMTMMLVIICLSVMSVLMLIILATWYIRYMRHGPKTNSSSAGTGTSESSLPESPDEHHFTHLKTSTYERPNFVYAGQLWPSQNHHIHPTQQQYPLLQHHQLWPGSQPQHLQKVTFRSASHHEMLDDRGDRGAQCDNTYEVPFGHLMPRQQKQYSFDGQLGSMSSMQDHFNSAVVPPTTPFLTQQIQRSCSMMQRPPLQPLQFYTHNNDS